MFFSSLHFALIFAITLCRVAFRFVFDFTFRFVFRFVFCLVRVSLSRFLINYIGDDDFDAETAKWLGMGYTLEQVHNRFSRC
jgi:hypothetical protein